MALKDLIGGGLGNLVQGIAGNMSEVSPEQLSREFGSYLMSGEKIQIGFALIRDKVVFTDRRILFFDKQGATGQKMRVCSIYLSTIVSVTAETAGFGLDDSEITITYIVSPFLKAHNISLESKKFEFPKRYNIQPLYVMLEELSYENRLIING